MEKNGVSVLELQPDSKKIILFELSIGQLESQWFNRGAGYFYRMLGTVYPLIDASLLDGITAINVTSIGSISSDSAPLLAVSSEAEVQSTELSFFFSSSAGVIYIHLQDGDEPSLHKVVLGITYGIANRDGVWGTTHFESRLLSAPSITKSKDPLFFGKLAFTGGTYVADNKPAPGRTAGPFDEIGELNYIFGSYARALVGFNDEEYGDFSAADYGLVDTIQVGPDTLTVKLKDPRSAFSKKLPESIFDQTTYANLDDSNVGKGISIGYGQMLKVPAVCTNQGGTTPFSFKLFDTSRHTGINSIDAVHVEGVAKTPASTDLVNAVFTLTSSQYSPGDEVLVDCHGYVDSTGALIKNALDVVKDILVTWLEMPFITAAFDVARWNAITVGCPDVGIFSQDPTEAIELIETIVASARVNFLCADNGVLTVSRYNKYQAAQQIFTQAMLLETPVVSYDPSEVIVSTMIGYARNWSTGECQYLLDKSQYDVIYAKFHNNKNDMKVFDTVLTNAIDAQAFSDDVLDIGGDVTKKFQVSLKFQPLHREVGDIIQVPVRRRNGSPILGETVAEIINIQKDLMNAAILLTCRWIRKIPDYIYVQGGYWGEGYWGDGVWVATYQETIE